jgi:hypothetical protein
MRCGVAAVEEASTKRAASQPFFDGGRLRATAHTLTSMQMLVPRMQRDHSRRSKLLLTRLRTRRARGIEELIDQPRDLFRFLLAEVTQQ